VHINGLNTEAFTGGQTPLLSTIELYDKLQDELPEFVKALIAKGNIKSNWYFLGPEITVSIQE